MSALTVDSWGLTPLRLDFANQAISGTFVANAADAYGRGIDLYVTDNGEPASMADMKVYLLWRHSNGNQGQTEFTAVNAASGHYKVYYPAGMMREGIVVARVSIYIGETTPITGSRDFRINVERNPINEEDAMASDDFSAFVQATIDLNTLNDNITAAERARVTEFAALKSASEAATDAANAAAADATAAAEDARGAISENLRFVVGIREYSDGTNRMVFIDHGEAE